MSNILERNNPVEEIKEDSQEGEDSRSKKEIDPNFQQEQNEGEITIEIDAENMIGAPFIDSKYNEKEENKFSSKNPNNKSLSFNEIFQKNIEESNDGKQTLGGEEKIEILEVHNSKILFNIFQRIQ